MKEITTQAWTAREIRTPTPPPVAKWDEKEFNKQVVRPSPMMKQLSPRVGVPSPSHFGVYQQHHQTIDSEAASLFAEFEQMIQQTGAKEVIGIPSELPGGAGRDTGVAPVASPRTSKITTSLMQQQKKCLDMQFRVMHNLVNHRYAPRSPSEFPSSWSQAAGSSTGRRAHPMDRIIHRDYPPTRGRPRAGSRQARHNNLMAGIGFEIAQDGSASISIGQPYDAHRRKSRNSLYQRKGQLPKESVRFLRRWLFDHFAHPYPIDDEKKMLAKDTGLTVRQINYWFVNARVRIWRPLMKGGINGPKAPKLSNEEIAAYQRSMADQAMAHAKRSMLVVESPAEMPTELSGRHARAMNSPRPGDRHDGLLSPRIIKTEPAAKRQRTV